MAEATRSIASLDENSMVDVKFIANLCSVTRQTVWNWAKVGVIPKPSVKIGRRISRWRWADVREALAKRGFEVKG